MSFEEAIERADIELDKIAYNAEFNENKGLRMAFSNKMEWFPIIVYLAKKGLQAEKTLKGGEGK